MTKLSKSALYYRSHPEARKVKAKTDSAINRRPSQVKKRVESNRKVREAHARGYNTTGMDYDHAVNRFVKTSTNRGRKGEGNRGDGKRHL